jgi:hypothetical protein
MKRQIISILLCVLLFSFEANSQLQTTYRAEAFGSVASGENTPFWMLYHNWGMVPLNANNFYIRGGVFHQQTINKDWLFSAGVDIAGSSPHAYGDVWIQQLYGELNWKSLRLNIGSKEDYISLLNPYLSSGDFNASNNARPQPEIKASIPEFILVPYTKEIMYIRGHFAVGCLTDGEWQEDVARPHNRDYAKNVLTHHKSAYLRLGNVEKRNKLQFTFGLDHHALYGGDLYQCKRNPETGQTEYVVQRQPRGVDDLLRVILAREGSESSSAADRANAAGSSIGAYLFKFDYRLKNRDVLSVYKQHFFEDGSGMRFQNYRDGLYGIEYKTGRKSLLSGAVFEYAYTKNQTGPIHFLIKSEYYRSLRDKGNGNDHYYNNPDYIQGPSYYGRTTGTPLFLSPEYNRDGRLNFTSSRIIAYHLGIEGYLCPALQYRLLATTGQTWGLYFVPFTSVRKGIASVLDLTYSCPKVQDLDIKLSLGFNKGEFFSDDTFGGGITITKKGVIFKK